MTALPLDSRFPANQQPTLEGRKRTIQKLTNDGNDMLQTAIIQIKMAMANRNKIKLNGSAEAEKKWKMAMNDTNKAYELLERAKTTLNKATAIQNEISIKGGRRKSHRKHNKHHKRRATRRQR